MTAPRDAMRTFIWCDQCGRVYSAFGDAESARRQWVLHSGVCDGERDICHSCSRWNELKARMK